MRQQPEYEKIVVHPLDEEYQRTRCNPYIARLQEDTQWVGNRSIGGLCHDKYAGMSLDCIDVLLPEEAKLVCLLRYTTAISLLDDGIYIILPMSGNVARVYALFHDAKAENVDRYERSGLCFTQAPSDDPTYLNLAGDGSHPPWIKKMLYRMKQVGTVCAPLEFDAASMMSKDLYPGACLKYWRDGLREWELEDVKRAD